MFILPAYRLQPLRVVALGAEDLAVGVVPVRGHGGVLDHRGLKVEAAVRHEHQRVRLG